MKRWRVEFSLEGRVLSVEPLPPGEQRPEVVFVIAETREIARKKAYNLYCARKKKAAKKRLHENGQCACGRKQDRMHPDGTPMLTCSTCAVKQKAWTERHRERLAQAQEAEDQGRPPPPPHVRNEAARVEANLGRQRDRRAELRLETLIEVRQKWQESTNVGRFARWLDQEIDALAKGASGAGRASLSVVR